LFISLSIIFYSLAFALCVFCKRKRLTEGVSQWGVLGEKFVGVDFRRSHRRAVGELNFGEDLLEEL
jgi:hypothetical protein